MSWLPRAQIARQVNPTAGLIVFLVAFAIAGAAAALKYGQVADRLAERHRRLPWLLRQIGRDNPIVVSGGWSCAPGLRWDN